MSTTELVLMEQDPEVERLRTEMSVLITQEDLDRLELAVHTLDANGIHDENEFRSANELLAMIADYAAMVEEKAGPPIAVAHARHSLLCDIAKIWRERFSAIATFKKSPKNLRAKVERAMANFRIEQERLRQQQERELARLSEKLKREKLAEAKKLMAQGAVAEAKEIRDAALATTAPTLPQVKPTLKGTTERINWTVTITDLAALVAAVAAGTVPLGALEADEGFIRTAASSQNGLNWPGVKTIPDLGFAVRRKGL